jgi:hypothetical protein
MHKEYIVYEGKEFTIEWYYTANGKSQAKEYFDELDLDRKLMPLPCLRQWQI